MNTLSNDIPSQMVIGETWGRWEMGDGNSQPDTGYIDLFEVGTTDVDVDVDENNLMGYETRALTCLHVHT